MLIRRLPKPKRRSERWQSPAHRNFVRRHACVVCDASAPIEVAHVRLGGGGGMSRKPDDWRTVALCKDCHTRQHSVGERTFWQGRDVEAIIDAFCKASPRAREIWEARNG